MTDQGSSQPDPSPDPAELPSQPTAGVGATADVGTRFLARLIDHIILGVVLFAIIIPLAIGAIFADVSPFAFFGGLSGGAIVSSIVVAALTIGYFAFMESNSGQTIGKMAMGLKTVAPSGGNPTIEEGIKRNAWYALGIIPWLGGLAQLGAIIYIAVTISNSATNTGWHDEFAGGTRVIKTK